MAKACPLMRSVRLAGAYAACAIGSGFATGQEIMQFFTSHGIMGMAGIVLTTVIFSWCGASFMKHGFDFSLRSPEEVQNFYFGKRLGKIAAFAMPIFLYLFYIVMISGAGAALSEYFGISSYPGRILMSLLTLITVLLGLSGLTELLGRLGIVIIFFTLLIGILGFVRDPGGIADVPGLLFSTGIPKASESWLLSALLYPGFNAIFVMVLSCCLGADADDRQEAVIGGALGGILFGLAIFVMNLGLLANLGAVGNKAVPTVALAKLISPFLSAGFSLIVLCGIYTTAVPMLWSVVRYFAEDQTKESAVTAVLLSAVGLVPGLPDFGRLVSVIYPLSGYIGTGILILTALRDLQLYKKKQYPYEKSSQQNNLWG